MEGDEREKGKGKLKGQGKGSKGPYVLCGKQIYKLEVILRFWDSRFSGWRPTLDAQSGESNKCSTRRSKDRRIIKN